MELPDNLRALFEKPAWRSEQGDYAEYMDERYPEAGVCIRRKNGQLVAIIDTKLWDEAQVSKKSRP